LPLAAYLLEKGKGDVNVKTSETGVTPLIISAYRGLLDVVKFLIEAKADVDLSSNDGTSPLSGACRENRLEVVKYLIQEGADVEKAESNITPLGIACIEGQLGVV